MTKIKICGLNRLCDIDFVNEAMPDYAGFVFFPKSRRNVTAEQAMTLKRRLNPGIKAVGVFVNKEIREVADLANHHVIDMIQLHGTEGISYIEELKKMTGKTIIKAFQAGTVTEEQMNEFPVEYYLIDSGQGTGKTFDWNLVPRSEKPWFLAGGISIDNVEEAIERLHPYAVDFSSSVETDGVKDGDKILEIVRRIRNVER